MRCKHCGSECAEPLADELTTEECLNLCMDLKTMGVDFVTLTGGEPTTRKDWNIIVKRLTSNHITTCIISNGWLVDKATISKIKDSKVRLFAISMDGMEETHDFIRKKGSFQKDIKTLCEFKQNGLETMVATTINNRNIVELEDMYKCFSAIGLDRWQLQISFPMGNFTKQDSFSFTPDLIGKIVDFAYSKRGGNIKIHFTDGIGYYNSKQQQLQHGACWTGCTAGKQSVGILQNGDVIGCTSIRNKNMVEGNIRERSIIDIWNSDNSFTWNRKMEKSKLKGICQKCQYGNTCLGGCSNSRYTLNGNVCSENLFCMYNYQVKEIEKTIKTFLQKTLIQLKNSLIVSKQYQIAEIVLCKLISSYANAAKDLLEEFCYVNYKLENYEVCIETCNKIFNIDKDDWLAQAIEKIIFLEFGKGPLPENLISFYRKNDMNKIEIDVCHELYLAEKENRNIEAQDKLLNLIQQQAQYRSGEETGLASS